MPFTTSAHATPDLRAAFHDAVEAYEACENGEPEPVVICADQLLPIARVCGLLWNSTDTLPVLWVSVLADLQHASNTPLRQGASYAQGARILRRLIAATQSAAAA